MATWCVIVAGCMVWAAGGEVPAEPIPLWPGEPPEGSKDGFVPTLTPFLLEGESPRGAVVVVPGGGYRARSAYGRTPIARRFNEAGFHAFVLDYRVSPNRHPAPLMDAARAVRMVRANAEEWRVKPDKIAVLGFSAGGHLAASLAVFFDGGEPDAEDPVERMSSRPDAVVLGYPVISSGPHGHRGSFDNLLGAEATEADREKLSIEKHVHSGMPPAFLWSTADDELVPVENTLMLAAAMRQKEIPFEMHIYPHGPHAMGLAAKDPHVATWIPLCVEWLHGMGW